VKIVVLAGGIGGARFLLGVMALLGWDPVGPRPAGSADEITAVGNTADDIRLHNLQICPDLDSCLYTTSGASDPDRGWGRLDETWSVAGELEAYGAEAPWFSLGDKDIATHLVRTRMLDAGYPLSAVTEALATRWKPGVRLLPMSDDRVETHVVVTDPQAGGGASEEPSGDGIYGDGVSGDGASGDGVSGDETSSHDGSGPLVAIHFQEWWIRYRAALPAHAITPIGADEARPAPGVLEAIGDADVVLIAPSNPVVSIGTILAVPGIADAVRATAAPVVGVSGIIAGSPVRGHADACLAAIGVECSAQGVATHYGARSAGGLLDAFLVADSDAARVPGLTVGHAPLLMRDPVATAAMVTSALELVDVHR
jgi:LPPG:FO 2-phospho-L-lactate transferase